MPKDRSMEAPRVRNKRISLYERYKNRLQMVKVTNNVGNNVDRNK